MTEHDELKRYADGGGGPELSAGIALARGEGPSAEQRARLRAKLGLPVQAPASTRESSSAASTASTALGKLTMGAAILALAGAAYWWLPREPAPSTPNEAPRPPIEQAAVSEPVVVATPEPAPVEEVPAPASRSRREAKKLPARANEALPAVDAAAELALLRRARSHVRSAPARALALVAEHEQRFASGALVEEREVIAIEALLLSGDRALGEARAAAFIARFPHSAHARRVRVLLSEQGASDALPIKETRGSATPSR